ncbi:MAG TPA: hypothetical protein VFC68_07650 [Treponemataceae bacterium]|nr:hypothetical protein [Treponemataceae bacterium]
MAKEKKMHKGTFFVMVFLAVLATCLIVEYNTLFFSTFLDNRIEKHKTDIHYLKAESYPLHFVITDRKSTNTEKEDVISAKVSFYTADNIMITEPSTYIIRGKEVFFDFIIVEKKEGSKLVFPYSIFSDTIAPDDAIFIAPLYNIKGFPAIFGRSKATGLSDISTGSNEFDKELSAIYADILKRKELKNSYGNAVHDTCKLGAFIVGQEYRVLVHTKGGIEIVMGE